MLPPHHAWKYRTVSVSADSPAPPIAGWPSAPVHMNTAPWLHPFIRDFSATTSRSAPSHCFPTMALAGPLLEPLGYRRRFGTRSCQPVPRGLFFPHRLCSCATDEAHLFAGAQSTPCSSQSLQARFSRMVTTTKYSAGFTSSCSLFS
jgi:hypothetical protein